MDVKLCRACLKLQGQKSLQDTYKGEKLSTYFYECIGLKILEDSLIPQSICEMCLDKLYFCYSFRKLCIQSDNIIKNHFSLPLENNCNLPSKIGSCEHESEEYKGDENPEGRNEPSSKSIQELHYADDFQFSFKHKQKRKNRKTKHVCEVCGYCANDNYTLKLHSNKHLKHMDKTHSCHLCTKKFSTSTSLKSHISRHNNLNSLMCEECGCRFSAAAHLRAHKRSTHSGLRPYKCHLCPRAFALLSNLSVHKKIHAGIKPHKCQTCGKCFTTTSDLKGHIRTHSGEKPHVCSVCEKGFSLRSNLNVHMQIHLLNNSKINCPKCDKKFSSKASLKSHQKIHSGERPYICEICSASFTHYNTLKSHQSVHTRAKNYACTKCDKKFSRASILKIHLKKHVNEDIRQSKNTQIVDKNNAEILELDPKSHKNNSAISVDNSIPVSQEWQT